MIEGVYQNDVVVHHNARQRHYADTSEKRAERTPQHQQTQEHPGSGHNHREQNQRALVEIIELGHQQDKHNRERQ